VSGALATLNVTPWPLPAVALRPRLSSGDRQEPQAAIPRRAPAYPSVDCLAMGAHVPARQ
jgi:hypothetical protein